MSPHSKKIPLALSLIFLALCVCIFIFLYKKIHKDNTTAQQVGREWQTEATQRQEVRSLDNSIKSIDAQRAQLESHFVQSSNIVPFLDTLEKIGLQAKVLAQVTSVDILKDNTGLLVNIKATGSFEAVYSFLVLLENAPYELEFTLADIQKDLGGNEINTATGVQSPGWTATFKVRLLSFIK